MKPSKSYIPVEIANVLSIGIKDKEQSLRPILRHTDIIGNTFYKRLVDEMENYSVKWPPVWVEDVMGALEIIYSFADEMIQDWECDTFCKEQPPIISGIELEYIVGNELILKDQDFQDNFLKRVQTIPTGYLNNELNCEFYDAENNSCRLESPPLICKLQKQDLEDKTWEQLFNLFYYVIDQASLIEPSLLYGTNFANFLINYYYVAPYFDRMDEFQSREEMYNAINKNLTELGIVRSWMKIGFESHNYILSVDNNITRLYKKTIVKRNDKCPCGSGKKYKHCCAF